MLDSSRCKLDVPQDCSVSTQDRHDKFVSMLQALETRWREHCDGARITLKIIDSARTKVNANPRTTIFHQDSRLTLLPLDYNNMMETYDLEERIHTLTITFVTEFTLRVRAEFFHRPLTLIGRISPKTAEYGENMEDDGINLSVQGLNSILLNEEFTEKHVFRLLQGKAMEPPVLTRRVEHQMMAMKPLVLKIETRHLSTTRIAIVAKAVNTHTILDLNLIDLQLHLNQFTHNNKPFSLHSSGYRICQGMDDQFPITLRSQETYNFVFVIEEVMMEVEDKGVTEVNAKIVNGIMIGPSQQSLLTITWQVPISPGEDESTQRTITEQHTILWSPQPLQVVLNSSELQLERLNGMLPSMNSRGIVSYLRLDRDCSISMRLASSQFKHQFHLGHTSILCIVITNRSKTAEFDLTMALPHSSSTCLSVNENNTSRSSLPQTWLPFEASHHLGYVLVQIMQSINQCYKWLLLNFHNDCIRLIRPGESIRKSVRVVFLRSGCCDLNSFLLFDHMSQTWYLPSSHLTPSSNTIEDVICDQSWVVFVRN